MTKYYKATFSDGTVLRRSTVSRTYTYAYLSQGKYVSTQNGDDRGWHKSGFSSSEEQARKNMVAETAWTRRDSKYMRDTERLIDEVAPVVEITVAEYRSLAGAS